MKKILTSIAILIFANGFSQTIDIGPNEYAFRYTLDNDFGLFFNQSDGRYEFLNATANPVIGFNANTGNFTTNLGFEAGSDLLIGNNRYAFRAASNPNYGLFFNAGSTEYQFLDNSASPIFALNANTGEYSTDIEFEAGSGVVVKPNTFGLRSSANPGAGLFFGDSEYLFLNSLGVPVLGIDRNTGDTRITGGLKLGLSSLNESGSIRWTGADFEGYDGFNWVSLTSSGSSSSSGSLQDAYDEGNTIVANDGSVSIEGNDGLDIRGAFGSGQLPNYGITGASRFYFNPRKASIRAGYVDGGKWDDANVGNYSVAFGQNTTASGTWSTAFGAQNQAMGAGSLTFGLNNTTESGAVYSFASGTGSSTSDAYGFAHGADVSSEGLAAVGFGNNINATGNHSFSAGLNNESIGSYAVSFGEDNSATGDWAFALGNNNTATDESAFAFGDNCDATGLFSVSGGTFCNAVGDAAVALGNSCNANGDASVALGFVNRADGSRSFAVGSGCEADGDRSVAMGDATDADGSASTSMGKGTVAVSAFETAIGAYNTGYSANSTTTFDAEDRLFVIGNGETNATRSDAMVVLKNGNVGVGTSTPDAKLVISDVPPQTVGISLEGGSNYLNFDGWEIGKAEGETFPVLDDDLVFRLFDEPQFNLWSTYFTCATDNSANLGRLSVRWNTIFASNGTINTSDAREKKNIKTLDYGLETLMKLKPVSYEWKKDVSNTGTKLGFVAQDLLEVVPEVVVTKERVENRETGEVTYEEAERMGVFYDDLIPVLTKAIQEQQEQIEEVVEENAELKKENEDLRSDVKDLLESMQRFEQDLQTCCFSSQSGTSSEVENSSTEAAELGQNIPNPFSESTVIRYYLPNGAANAIIRITDMEGSPVEDIQPGAARGANQVEFQTQGLASGTYLYSLFVDGKFVDTKKMLIAK